MRSLNYDIVTKMAAAAFRKRSAPPYVTRKANDRKEKPRLSFVLLDWNCRERFHTLDWLARQNVPRSDYEIIWVELYDTVNKAVMDKVDVYITCGQYGMYHKHEGYNAGLLEARGELICVCDSDAVFPPDFVDSVFKSFYKDGYKSPVPLVLMHHELRTSFTYPEDLAGTEDLKDRRKWKWWRIVPNAGACMTARRSDALRYGGFDEHESLRGYICGPYELGWRLVNAGIPEVWHSLKVVLWHFAHPDPIGANGILPSLGRLMENTHPHVDIHAIAAVDAFSSGRMLPWKENPRIFEIRMRHRKVGTKFEEKYSVMPCGPEGFPKSVLFRLKAGLWGEFFLEMLFRVPGLAFLKPIIWPSKDHEPRIIGETPEYNFICYCARYYAVPKSLGPVDLDDEEQISNPLIIQSETEQDVRAAVEMYKSEATPTLVETKNEINIVRFMGFYYMIPCAAGKIDFAKAEDRNHPMIRKTQNKDEIDSILKDMLEPAM